MEKEKEVKLDRRRRWFAFGGNIVRNEKITMPCTGCSCDCSDGHGCNHGNSGCEDCGYTKKRVVSFPVYALDNNNNPIKTDREDFFKF